ncbi:Lrp/AsnC family transcriptional regulator [Aureimonas fodinaquatilis]|uniref:Lrp/AsnC family transcriptional regulator n=1 Tax=Aureimonas fodinaquatilis TaxID=2565783 RepID=A0A5B0DU42_9HYPH|nr:Lrp/AsnC family transcriptional regulator [Aureimonas fodinaquatilis]KAA0969455.1 Lrp/AsnC family transcriptional regulator [Aureimonas fodinaquatilis]
MREKSGSGRIELDKTDLAILKILQLDNKTPQRRIAEAVHLSAPAVQRRIKRMEETGVIAGNAALIDPAKVGRAITLFVEVQMESERAEMFDDAKRLFSSVPEVQQCYYVTGDVDFILIVVVRTMAEYEVLTRRLFFENPNVKRFRTLVCMDRIKAGLTVPLG